MGPINRRAVRIANIAIDLSTAAAAALLVVVLAAGGLFTPAATDGTARTPAYALLETSGITRA